jgi:hypothetical protein
MGERGWVDEMLKRECGVSGLWRSCDGVDGGGCVGGGLWGFGEKWRALSGVERFGKWLGTLVQATPFVF